MKDENVPNDLLSTLNKRAILIKKLEDYLTYHNIQIDKEYVDTLSDAKIAEQVEVWSPIRQDIIRKSIGLETNS
jgi:hypothetical protein